MYSKYGYLQPQQSENGSQYEQQSQLMIQQTDPLYQPTKKQIQEYAIELLGMNLPQDDHLLSLAREAMKAPMPDCWQTYQRANGDIYYKHKVTQQKSDEHPIEIQYRKKYQQEKEKAARKTLKSKIPLKNLAGSSGGMGGGKVVLGGLGNSNSQIGWGAGSNQMALLKGNQSQVSIRNDSQLIFEDDGEILRKFDKELEELEASLNKKLATVRTNEEESYYAFEKRARNNHNQEMDRLKLEGQKEVSYEERLRNQKKRASAQLEDQFDGNFKRQRLVLEKTSEQNLKNSEIELEANYNKKAYDEQSEFQRKIELKSKQFQQLKQQSEREKQKMQAKSKTQLQQTKSSLLNSKSVHVNQQLQNRLRKTTQQIDEKLKNQMMYLQEQFNKISNSVRGSPENRIQQMMRQKVNLQEISDKKIQMIKQKERKTIDQQTNIQLLEQKNKIRKKIEVKQQQLIKELEQSLLKDQEKQADKIKRQYQQKWTVLEGEIYQSFKDKIQQFEQKKNKSIINIRESFIKQIQQKAQNLQDENNSNIVKLQIEQKKFQIQNKTRLIESVKKQIQNNDIRLEKVNFIWKLFRTKDKIEITNLLKKQLEVKKIYIRQLAGDSDTLIDQINQVLSEHITQLKQATKQLQSDKSLLLRVFKHLQSNTVLPSYQKQKATQSMSYSSKIQHMSYPTSDLLSKYNKDVKIMRQNAKRIQQYQQLIKKVELDEIDIEELDGYELEYIVPELRDELGKHGMNHKDIGLEEIGGKTVVGGRFNLKEIGGHNTDLISTKNVRHMFSEHSKFLSGVKNQLNQKLAQIRCSSQFY